MNVFLTGDINVGKTRLINRFVEQYCGSVGGYKTVRKKSRIDDFYGVYLLDIRNNENLLCAMSRVGSCKPDKSLKSYNTVFETLGVKLLTFDEMPELVIMDELGVLEEKCMLFGQKVHDCLEAKTDVLGVIKKRKSAFLEGIRNRKDVIVFEVNKSNADEVYNKIIKIFC